MFGKYTHAYTKIKWDKAEGPTINKTFITYTSTFYNAFKIANRTNVHREPMFHQQRHIPSIMKLPTC